ncbi:MAG: response regulator [Terriglobales bacterium]|jgi:CheY-like chemotaxis protein
MTTPPLLTSKLPTPIPAVDKKRRVLLVDASSHKRELRAETMRKLGIEVDSAADIGEARCWWKADLYDLVLINVENKQSTRDKFCDDIRASAPRQRFAFLVGAPEYLSNSPGTTSPLQLDDQQDEDLPVADVKAALTVNLGDLRQRWGILEASRRISAVRSASTARTQAMRDRPAPPRDLETRYAGYAAPETRTLDDLLRNDLLGKDLQ